MSITKRQEQILELLRESGFMTVRRLSELTFTSESSVRRDLNVLENLSLAKRTHGGASVFSESNRAVPLTSRMSRNVGEKKRIAKAASRFLSDGQTVMLDGSSTASFLVPFIARYKDMIVFTNNMNTAMKAISHGIVTHCIGGCSVNHSAVLSGELAYKAAESIYPDILFFSSRSLDADGNIYDPIPEENHIRAVMLGNCTLKIFLCDSEKFGSRSLYKLASLDDIDAAVFDKPYPELKTKCRIIV